MDQPFVVVYGGGTEGGAPAHLLNLLAHLDRSRFRPHFASLGRDALGAEVRALGVPYAVAASPGALAALVRETGARFLHTHGVRANVLGRLVGLRTGRPVLTTVHSILRYDYDHWRSRLMALALERATLPLTRHFITISAAVQADLLRRGARPDRISIVYNGIAPAPPGDRAALRRELGAPDQVRVMGTIARLHPTKGLGYLLQAVAALPPEAGPWRLYLCGDGPSRDELQAAARALPCAHDIHFLGHVPEARRLLPAFDVFVLPSLMEGMGIAALEAMAAGVPVVATRVGGIPELVVAGESGLLVPPADPAALAAALREVLENPARATSLAAAGHARFQERFTARQFARATEAVYAQYGLDKASR